MIKKVSTIAGIILLATFILWRITDAPERNAAEELRMKEQIMQTDLNITEKLCLNHCTLSVSEALDQLDQNRSAEPLEELKKMNKQNENIKLAVWKNADGKTYSVKAKDLPKDQTFINKMEQMLNKAENELTASKSYVSDKWMHGSHPYRVIGKRENDATITAVISHSMIPQLAAEQRKNLRLVPYPSEKRSKMQSVDFDTMQKIKVDHPEENEGTSHYYDGEVVVGFRKELSGDEIRSIEKETKSKVVTKLNHTLVFRSDEWTTDQLMNYFNQMDIQYVEPNYLYLTNQTEVSAPNDTLFNPYQWNLPAIDALHAWNVSKGSEDVIVAVLDTGVDLQHADLQGKLVGGINIVDTSKQPQDDVGHGTHVAGIIAASVNNNQGIAGLSWYNKIMPIKVLDSTGAGSTYAVAQGIIWATDQGAKVINMSLGNYAQAEFLHEAIRYAYDRDVLLIAATGNDATSQPGYPAAYPEVLAVAATDQNRSVASFSNYGDYVDVAAPGVNIASTYPGSQYVAMSGTSMATPHVAALAAMIRSKNPNLTNQEVMDMIRNTADDLGAQGKDAYYGYGEINMANALGMKLHSEQSQKQEVTQMNWLQRLILSIRDFIAG